MSVLFDQTRVRNRVRESLEKAYHEADPLLLEKYRYVFRKEVSFFRRSFVAAWLLMELDQAGSGRFRSRAAANGEGRGKREAPRPGAAPRFLPEEESARLFIGAGRSRRVFPGEILALILSKCAVSREDIGVIRIMDSYSFVQVRSGLADLIIKTLNGKNFRGRPLAVNYARARKDSAGGAGNTGGAEDGTPGDAAWDEADAIEDEGENGNGFSSEPGEEPEDQDDAENIQGQPQKE